MFWTYFIIKLQNDALKTAFQTFTSIVRGDLLPFYFVDVNNDFPGTYGYSINGTITYMHIEDYVPVTVNILGRNSITLKLKSHAATY